MTSVTFESAALNHGLSFLTPTERRLFDVLYGAGWVGSEAIAGAVWPEVVRPCAMKTFGTTRWRMAQKLARTPFRLQKGSQAWRLVEVRV